MSSNIITNSRDQDVNIFGEALFCHHSQSPRWTHFCRHNSQGWLLSSERGPGESKSVHCFWVSASQQLGPVLRHWNHREERKSVGRGIWGPSAWAVPRDQSWELQMPSCREEAGEGVRNWMHVPPPPHLIHILNPNPCGAVFGEGILRK